MDDKILIQGLEFHATIGINSAERALPQRMQADVEVGYDLAPAGESADLAATISYIDVATTVIEVATSREYELVEEMAARVVAALFERSPAASVRLRLLKVPPPAAVPLRAVGVEILRHRPTAQ